MAIKTNEGGYTNSVDQAFKSSLLDALAGYQAIESLLRDCIIKTYQLLDLTSHASVAFKPSRRTLDDLDRKGLCGLASAFKSLTPNTDLCDRIIETCTQRNDIAHRVALEYAKAKFKGSDARALNDKAAELAEAARSSLKLYLELSVVYDELLQASTQKDQTTGNGEE